MKKLTLLSLIIVFVQCTNEKIQENESPTEISDQPTAEPLTLSLEEANRLSALPIHCIQVEYPNKTGHVRGGADDLQSPQSLHPAFYGCFDWHSSVHGHWSLVNLMKQFPALDNRQQIEAMLVQNITKENIEKEVEYFKGEHNKTFERTYGWAWLLKLAEELHTWDDSLARQLEQNLQPLTTHIAGAYLDFLPKLVYPIRVGEHTNTAFGLTFAYDYAVAVGDTTLVRLIESRARSFYQEDADCPLAWEPSGYDFLSPCLEEADIMRRVLPKEEFKVWLQRFLPKLQSKDFKLEVGKVGSRTDGKLVHLDGVNFSRAWCLYGIANQYPAYAHLKVIADQHIRHSLPSITDGNYEGTHWLGTFAIYALNVASNVQVD